MSSKLRKRSNFTIASNAVVYDESISYKAKGIYLYLCSRPDGWEFRIKEIVSQSSDKIDSVRSGLKELEEAGFITRTRINGEGGRFHYDFEIHETPTGKPCGEQPYTVQPCMEKPYTVKTVTVKSDTNNTDILNNTDRNNTEENNTEENNTDRNIKKSKPKKVEDLAEDRWYSDSLKAAVVDYETHIKDLGKTYKKTDRAWELFLDAVDGIVRTHGEAVAIQQLHEAIAHNWKSVYPPKQVQSQQWQQQRPRNEATATDAWRKQWDEEFGA